MAYIELQNTGVNNYVGDFTPASSEEIGEWTKHTFDTEGGEGPTCINGSDFTVFTRARDPHKVVFFLNVATQTQYRQILLDGHDPLNPAYPDRYKRYIVSGSGSHTALGTDLYYIETANGVPLYQWTDDFVNNGVGWIDIVEDFVPLP